MEAWREAYREVRPIVWVAWVLAALRLTLEAAHLADSWTFAVSVYYGVATLLLFCGITGQLDHLRWKRLLLGSVVLGVLCFGVPNAIAYTTAQLAGWEHGRFYHDAAFHSALKRHQEAGLEEAAAKAAAEEDVGHADRSRAAPRAETTGGRVGAGLLVAGATTIAGTVFTLVLSVLFIGIPASLRRGRA
jgi:hypothetical protein